VPLCAALPADLCEAECDSTPLRTHVGRVLQRSLGLDPAVVPVETRFMVSFKVLLAKTQHGTPSGSQLPVPMSQHITVSAVL
jgi:hypothetical protein